MLPYIEIPTLELGPVELDAFSFLVCLAVIVGYELVVRRAPAFGFDTDDAGSIIAWTIFWGFVGSHVFDVIAYEPELVRENPLELLMIWKSMSSFGGIVGGVTAAWIISVRRGFSMQQRWAFVDLIAFVFPFAWIFGRMGCAVAHDHIGIPSQHWLAVDFPEGGRFDLGLLEMLYTIPVAILFAGLARKRWPHPFFFGLFFTLYGPVRFALDTLRAYDARYLGWTPGQYMAVLVTLIGLGTLWIALRSPGPGAETDAPS